MHTARTLGSRPLLAGAITREPVLLRDRFPEGAISDAWLAAYAEHIADQIGHPVPAWANSRKRIAPKPWFSTDSPAERALALRDSPAAFRKRNLFTPKVDLPLHLGAGRPPKTAEEKRRTNAERQRRFRNRRTMELELLRHAGAMVMAEK